MLFLFSLLLLLYFQYTRSIPIKRASVMSGEGTYYKVGLGSCGQTYSDDNLVAATHEGGQHCGQTITIHSKSKSVDVLIVDTCPGCADGDVDLSQAAFTKLASLDQGRIPITWSI